MTRRLQILFVVALAGVLVALGIAAAVLLGPIGLTVYGGVLAALLAAGITRGRRTSDAGAHACDCCATAAAAPAPAGTVKLS